VWRAGVVLPVDELRLLRVDEELFLVDRRLAQHAEVGQVVQVAQCSLALGDTLVYEVGGAAVGLLEDRFEQLARPDLGQPRALALGGGRGLLERNRGRGLCC
jgi:hypothetical protein